MDGLILINKPKDFTSHDIVKKMRILLNESKVGHFGTLDPMATGLILIGIGKATRLFPFYSKLTKIYKGQIKLGYSTDTYDSYGKPTTENKNVFPSEKKIHEIIKMFEGHISQIPPPYSAKKYKGKPLYKLARKNKKIKLPSTQIRIYNFTVLKYHPPYIDFVTKCSSGTYIRSLAHEIGKKAECGGHLSALERTDIDDFHINESFTVEQISSMVRKNKVNEFLSPLEKLLPQFPKITLSETGASKARNGTALKTDDILNIKSEISAEKKNDSLENKQIFRLFSPEGKLIALARKKQGKENIYPSTVLETEPKISTSKGEYHAK